ncbi:hypothetical protein [Streptomyces antibioticus]|uniref:Uncharacterized protein n=1 Tax=Streptomyces antibioticus TaxID=1890 RepID=A0AAE7CNN3_STRAT|nr:hypothetical protein [Streptomyces antibioticus]OOQ47267.1 hypothetical protein AFM16_31455 [Streptomyces antibioticus]QIT47584.1 hypothetical protein HCX60_32005 [Streptomyces antibioticus]
MTFRYRLLVAAHTVAVLAIAVAAVCLADLLPVPNPTTAWAADMAAGLFAGLGASTWLPCPCHRKDGHG